MPTCLTGKGWGVATIALSIAMGVVSSAPAHAKRATVLESSIELLENYDFIVIGAGTAGLTVGDRLSESGEYTVLVVEYGYLDSSHSIQAIHVPDVRSGPPDEYIAATRMYNITSIPQPRIANRTWGVAAGCLVGGSSAVNGMVFDRGSAEDYDAWVWAAGERHQAAFSKEWGWDNIFPWFKKSARLDIPTAEMVGAYGITYDTSAYGADGAIHASYQPYQFPKQQILWEAFKEVPGVKYPREHADGNAVGLLWVPNSVNFAKQRRSSAKSDHLEKEGGAGSRLNFHLLPAHRAIKVILTEGTKEPSGAAWRATGVKIAPRDGPLPEKLREIKAEREVIVSAGTLHTPQVLERSGIGSRDILEAAGVDVKVDLPGVGWNLHDHMTFNLTWKYNGAIFPYQQALTANETFAAEALAQWEANKTGPYTARFNNGAFLPLCVISERCEEIVAKILEQDIHSVVPANLDANLIAGTRQLLEVTARQYASGKSAIFEFPFGLSDTTRFVPLKILSRGSIHIAPNDDGATGRGDVEPILDWGAFTNPVDLDVLVEIFKFLRRFMASDPVQSTLAPEELVPGRNVTTDEDIRTFMRNTINPGGAHAVGTARMGPRELGGVLGPDLRVYGTEGLSVADNSVMPIIVTSHTASTAYAIGEKAADLILRRSKEVS